MPRFTGNTILAAIFLLLNILSTLIVINVLLSWVIRDTSNPIMGFLNSVTEPILLPIRTLLFRFNIGGEIFDFSPLVAVIIIQFLMNLINFT